MSKAHLTFKNFRPEVIEATKALFEARPWRDDVNVSAKTTAAQAWLDACATAYGVPPVSFTLFPESEALAEGMHYEPQYGEGVDRITTTKFSITNLFICFAVHRGEHSTCKAGQNPTGWGYSLFYQVKPKMFRARVREGRILGVEVKDLYTEETWARIVAANLDPAQKNILGVLARIDAGEDTSFASTEIMSISDEADALASLDDDHDDAPTMTASSVEPDADVAEVIEEAAADDLDTLPLVELRRRSRGVISGGYNMRRSDLIAALRSVS